MDSDSAPAASDEFRELTFVDEAMFEATIWISPTPVGPSQQDQDFVKQQLAGRTPDQAAMRSSSPPAAEPGGVRKPKNAATDAQRILGQWVCVDCNDDGQAIRNCENIHAVFTDKEGKIAGETGGLAFKYRLDTKSNPKHCDLLLLPLEATTVHALYRFDDASLLLVKVGDRWYAKN